MLRSLENLLGYQIVATNGPIGTVGDFLFDDDSWTVRYLAVAAGGWLNRKQVVLATSAIDNIADDKRELRVGLTRESVLSSPGLDSAKPVSRQKEILLAEHYGWKPYWTPDPLFAVEIPSERMPVEGAVEGCDPHLRSLREITTYRVCGGGPPGYVADLIAKTATWRIHGLVCSESRTRLTAASLIPPESVQEIDWTNRRLRLADAAEAPKFDPAAPVNIVRVVRYYDYTGRLHHTKELPPSAEGETEW